MLGLFLATAALFFVSWWGRHSDWQVILVILISYSYYCVAGTLYWALYQEAEFAGVHWGIDTLLWSAQVLAYSTVVLVAAIIAVSFGTTTKRATLQLSRFPNNVQFGPWRDMPNAYWVLLFVGLAASLFVLVTGSFSDITFDTRNQFFLICYQLSDLLVPVTLFTVAVRGYSRATVLMIFFFTLYVVLVGFRYKLALLFIPILLDQFSRRGSVSEKAVSLAGLGTAAALLFSLMTLYRVKFGIPDLTRQIDNPLDDFFYGIFAEANILFGLSSILINYLEANVVYMIDPFVDAVKEWIPRLILPDRVTGDYLYLMQGGFRSDMGITSGTAYPWIGEFLIAFGYFGFVLGPLFLACIYVYLKAKLLRYSGSLRQYALGCANLAAVLGYYHFSRGYFPQISKAYLCIVVPYIYFCYAASGKRAQTSRGHRTLERTTMDEKGRKRPAVLRYSIDCGLRL
jgi:hypothetical protein